MRYIENRTFDEISVGDRAELTRTLKPEDIELFSALSGAVNPAHVDASSLGTDGFVGLIAHGMWGGTLIATLLGTELPGPGAIYHSQNLVFGASLSPGDTVAVEVSVAEMHPDTHMLVLDCRCTNQFGDTVIEGRVEAVAPSEKIRRPQVALPDMQLHPQGAQYQKLIGATANLKPVRTAVAHPCDDASLSGALEAVSQGLIFATLVGPRAKIEAAAVECGRSLEGIEIIDVPHSHAAAARCVELVRAGQADAIMKGKLHTDELMSAVVDSELGLRTGRRMSHIFVLDVPHHPKPLMITDAAINIYPDLDAKRDIVQNAIDLAHALGIAMPKVAILSATETVNPKVVSTTDAASLCKMADRGQITGGLLDGPLAFDNAVSKAAAATKGIVSPVAGDADILVAPDLEAGNMMAKQLIYLAGADSAGIVMGARVPVILTSRADSTLSRLASCALAQLYIENLKDKVRS